MFNLNKELDINENIEVILEEMREREEYSCTALEVCPLNVCEIHDL